MTPAEHQLLRALYFHALAPSLANQDAVRAAGAALDTETGRKLNGPKGDIGIPTTEQNQGVGGELKIQPSELPIAEAVSRKILDRAAFGLCKYGVSLDDAGLDPAAWLLHLQEELLDGANYVESLMRAMRETPATAPVEPPHAAAPVLAPLAPEPAEAVLGRAGEALAWDGQQLPVHVPYIPGAPHPYGDDAYLMTTDGVARLFPSKEAAQRWLAAMGKAA